MQNTPSYNFFLNFFGNYKDKHDMGYLKVVMCLVTSTFFLVITYVFTLTKNVQDKKD